MKNSIEDIYLKVSFIKEDGTFKSGLDTHAEVAYKYSERLEKAIEDFFNNEHFEIKTFAEFKHQYSL